MQIKNQKNGKSQDIYIFTKGSLDPVEITNICKKKNEEIELLIFIILKNSEKLVLNTTNIISAKNVRAFTYIKAIIDDQASLQHSGLIKIEKSANLADTYLSSKILLLGGRSEAFSKPFLEIENHNVKAGHASSIGSINREELFYLQSRGLSETEAYSLIIGGFFEEQIQKIESLSIQEKVRKYLLC